MATTYTYKNGTGNHTTTFPFTFPYIKDTDVKVEVLESGAWVTKTKDTHYEFTNATTIKFKDGHAPADVDNNIKISRATDADKLTATFYPGSAIRSVDLNDNFTQNLYSTEESKETGDDAQLATDRLVAVTYDGGTTWTQTGNNTNASTDPKGVGYSITQAEAAVSTANTATTTANSAVTTANSAVTTANSATTTANSAVSTANAATTTANTASANAQNAVNVANGASTTAAAAFQRDGSATMTGNIVFEGATDDGNETTLTVTDPTADRTITIPNVTGTVVTTGDTGTVTSTMITDGTIATEDIANSAVTNTKLGDLAVTSGKLANGAVINTKLGDLAVTEGKLANLSVTTGKIAIGAVGPFQLQTGAANSDQIAHDAVNSVHYAAASIDEEHIADGNVTTDKIANANVTTGKLADNAVTIAKLGCEETTLTANSDTTIPTSKAVSDYVINLLNDAGGFVPILDDQKFPNANPDPNDDAGTIVSIADAGGLVVNGSGVSTTGRTLGGSTVTINGIDSSLHNTTIAAGKGMLVQTTSTLNTYDYHRLVLDEAGVASADTLISDFNERYRTSASRTADNHSSNHDGDLYFDQGTNTMYVYDGAYDAGGSWKQVTSAGEHKYLFLCPAGGSGAPTINNAIATYDLREGSNSGSPATVSVAAQLTVSVNGVIQKPNTGTSAPSEGFALVDGNTIIFGANLPTGSEVFIVQSGSATTINTPADNSVTTAKIASAAVTTAKIADDAVDGAKLANNIDIAGTLDVTGATTLDGALSLTGQTNHLAGSEHILMPAGGLLFQHNPGSGTENVLLMHTDYCKLYHDNNLKFETTSDGATVTGKLGIGTTTPDMLLDVTGTVTAGGGTDQDLQQWNIGSDNVKAEIKYDDASATRGYIFGTSTQHDLALQTNNTDRLHIAHDGKVSIGDSTPIGAFQVKSTESTKAFFRHADSNQTVLAISTNDTNATIESTHQAGGSGAYKPLAFKTGGAERMSITSDGKVGIGTTSPTTPLDVVGDAEFANNIYTGSKYTNSTGSFIGAAGTIQLRCDDGSDFFSCYTGGNAAGDRKFRLQNDGTATFAGNITATGGSSYIGAYQMYTGSPAVGTATAVGTDMIAGGSGQFTSKSSSSAATTAIAWRGYHGTTRTSLIQVDGSAEFAGSVKIGGTAAANEIDDYEEGTYTPEFSFTSQTGSFTYNNRSASYTKIGRLVTVNIMVYCSAIPTAGTDLQCTLPFAPADTVGHTTSDHVGSCIAYYAAAAGGSYAIITADTTYAHIVEQGVDADGGGGYDSMDYDDIESQFSIRATMSYCTSE